MTSDNFRNVALLIVGLVYGVTQVYFGISLFNQNAPNTEWVPQLTWGVLFLVFVIGFSVGMWLDEGPTGGFGLSGWGMLLGFGLWLVVGLVFLSVGYSRSKVWAFTTMGGLGVGITLFDLFVRS
jgi:hypothetical protein